MFELHHHHKVFKAKARLVYEIEQEAELIGLCREQKLLVSYSEMNQTRMSNIV